MAAGAPRAQQANARCLQVADGAGVAVIGDDGGHAVQRAYPVHRDGAELAGVGQHIARRGVRDDRAPDHDLRRVVVGEPGGGVDAAGSDERLVGVELVEERLGVRARAGPVAGAHRAAADQQVDAGPVGQLHRGGTELVSTRPRNAAGSARATSSAVVPTSMTIVSSGSTRLAASAAIARFRSTLRLLRAVKLPSSGPPGWPGGPAVHALQQPFGVQRAQVPPDRLDRYVELPGQVVRRRPHPRRAPRRGLPACAGLAACKRLLMTVLA